jgi:hypothetical protein
MEVGKPLQESSVGLMSVIRKSNFFHHIETRLATLISMNLCQYATLQWNHNFNGRIFQNSVYAQTQWRNCIVKGFMEVFLMKTEPLMHLVWFTMHRKKDYWNTAPVLGISSKYSNIDFAWRGNYLNVPGNRFTIKGSFGFNFLAIPAVQYIFLKANKNHLTKRIPFHQTKNASDYAEAIDYL